MCVCVQSTPQHPHPTQVQHTQSTLPPLPSLVNSMHSQQQPPPQPIKTNATLPQQSVPSNMVQAQNALNNNDVNQTFPTQTMNTNLLGAMLGMLHVQCSSLSVNFKNVIL